MKRKLLMGEINILLISVLVIILGSALWIFLTSLVPEKYGFPGVTHYEKEGYDVYTSLMPTTTDLFSVNGANSLIKVKNEEIKEFSFQSGTYLKFKDKPIIKISKPVDIALKFVSENEIFFSINGEGSTSIYLYNLNPDFTYTVKRDGKIFTDWQLINSTMFIYTELSEHIFEIFGTNESILWNKANDSISVYLLMKIQFYNSSSGEWEDENIVYQSSNPINLGANETIKLEDYFNGKWNTSQATHGSGLYRVLCAALDEKGDTIVNKDGSLALSTYNFTISDTIPPTISNITVSSITGASATITWKTNEPSTSLVKYGTSPGSYTYSKGDSTLTTSHIITLTNLIPNTTYYFVVNSTDASGNSNQSSEYNFTTKNVTLPVKLNLSAITSGNEVILGTIIKVYKDGIIFDDGTLNTTNKWKEVKNLEEKSEVDVEYELPSKVKLRIRNLNMTKNLTLVPVFVSNYTGELLSFVSIKSPVIALNDTDLNYGGGEITLPISGSINRILHCVNWNFSSSNCLKWQLHNLSDYNHTLNSTHIIFNVSSFDAYGAGYIDDMPPEITLVYPENGTSLPSGTTKTTIKITTDENATCRYSTISEFNFSDGTNFTTTGGLNHSFLYTGLSNGKSYNLYYKCKDMSGNVNDKSVHHFFSVAEKEEGGGTSGGGGGYSPTSNKITVENKGAIIKIEINLNKSVISPSLKVEQISTIKIQKPKGIIYQYFNITKRNFNNSIIKNSTIEFRVNNSWIKENGIKSVYLEKYENGWIKLDTKVINKTENYTYYRSETDSFSYFAIVGEKEILICKEGEKRCSDNNLEQCINNKWQIVESCEYGCNETTLKCNPKQIETERVCEEGRRRCLGNELQECRNNIWITIQSCNYGCNETTLECNPPKKPEKRNYLIYISILLAIIGGVLSYLWRDKIKDFLKRIRTERMEKRKLEETITSEKSELGEIENKIREVEEKIREMRKNGKDMSEIERELKIAKEDLDFGLPILAKNRINRILEKLKE